MRSCFPDKLSVLPRISQLIICEQTAQILWQNNKRELRVLMMHLITSSPEPSLKNSAMIFLDEVC